MRDDDREAYEEFFKQFGRTLKFGIYQSYGMAKDTLATCFCSTPLSSRR